MHGGWLVLWSCPINTGRQALPMSAMQRAINVAVGLVLVLAGAGIIYAFHTLHHWKGHDIWDFGFLLVTEAYSIVGSLFILLGLRYAFGNSGIIESIIARSVRHFIAAAVLLSLAILAAIIFNIHAHS
jgi:hypothetical protein